MKKEKLNKIISIAAKVLSILLFAVAITQLYVKFPFDVKQVLPGTYQVLVVFLKSLTTAAVGLGVLIPWFNAKNSRFVFAVLGIAVAVVNLAFLDTIMISWGKGSAIYTAAKGYAYSPFREVAFIIEQIILILSAGISIYEIINQKLYKAINPIYIILIAVGVPLLYSSPYFFQDLNLMFEITDSTKAAKGFNLVHIIFLLSSICIILGMFFSLFRKDYKTKQYVFSLISFAAIFNFFTVQIINDAGKFCFGNLPLHLCNTAVILIFIAYAFKREEFFYFSFFVNVIGCLFAMLMPNYGDDVYFWTYSTNRFWFNHLVAFSLPIAGMSLKMFERPKFKSMLKAIGIFTCYFILAMVLNAWFSNYDSVNYFFINDNFFFEKLDIGSGLKDNHVFEFFIGDLHFTFYYFFQPVVYIIFVGLMFVTWYIYDFFFNVADNHKELHYKKKIMSANFIDFKKELNGRPISDPLYLEDVGMVEIKHFTKIYSGSDKPSVDDLNLTIKDGEVYGFLGHNGAGKSTTIKSLVGIQSITSGQMIVDGFDVQKQPVEAKLRIGYVSDNHAVYERLTGREYINYIADLYMVKKEDRDERISKYTKMFKLEDAIDREIKSYSHGMKQKIVVIASLIHDPKVWVLDEPLTGLDPTSAYQIKECMKEHASRGNIVFFSSHVIEVVEKICTSICIIGHGKLQCQYSLKELKEKGISLEDLYLKYVSGEERIH